MHRLERASMIALALVLAGFAAGAAAAQTPEQFYKGKLLDLEIGYPTGGSNDAYGRLLANHLGRHIPGAPAIVPRNTPGAGSFLAVNRVYANLPKDGTVIALGAPTLALDERLGSQGVRFKTAELNFIGRVDSLINIVMMWKASKVKSIADAQMNVSTLSGTGAGSTVSIYPTVLNNVIGTKFKLVMGYRGSNEAMLAMERGEVEGNCGLGWTFLKLRKADWLREHKINILFQWALHRPPDLPDVPLIIDSTRSPADRQVFELLLAPQDMGRPFFAPPGVPAERLQALRDAFAQTLKDPQFLADADKMGLEVQHRGGEEVQQLVERIYASPADVVARAKAAAE